MVWYVDDLKISHMKNNAVEEIIAQVSKQYGKDADLTNHRGKLHEYLGMRLEYCTQDKVNIDMT